MKARFVPAEELTTENLTAEYYFEWGWKQTRGWAQTQGWDQATLHVHGPFKTKEDALKSAERCGAKHITLGHIIYPRPEDCFSLSVHTAIKDAQKVAETSSLEEGDDRFFEVKNDKKAQEELDEFMSKWAKKWAVPIRKIFSFVENVKVE